MFDPHVTITFIGGPDDGLELELERDQVLTGGKFPELWQSLEGREPIYKHKGPGGRYEFFGWGVEDYSDGDPAANQP